MNYKPYRNEATRSSLLQAVSQDGNEQAWSRFFDTYAGYVFAIARKRGLQETDADEIVQTIFLSLHKDGGVPGYDRERGRFHSYLAALTIWRIKDLFRKRASELKNVTSVPGADLERNSDGGSSIEEIFDEEWREAVRLKALAVFQTKVNPLHFSIFHALFFEGIDAGAVMKIYGVTRNNLYQIRSRTRMTFKKVLEEAEHEMDAPEIPPAGSPAHSSR